MNTMTAERPPAKAPRMRYPEQALAELMQAALILLLSKPFSAALALEKAILLPKMIVNSVGLVAFMRILDRLNRDLTIELVEQRAVALLIAQECLPYL